jgi:hypothetical protein
LPRNDEAQRDRGGFEGEHAMLDLVATACAGLFAGAAVYINIVEHPARLSCGIDLAIREFGPSYHRATIMQASLAIVGCGAGLVAAWQRGAVELGIAALLLGSVVPFTLLVILPTNKRLLDPALGRNSAEAAQLLKRWGWLHAVRSVASTLAFVLFIASVAK